MTSPAARERGASLSGAGLSQSSWREDCVCISMRRVASNTSRPDSLAATTTPWKVSPRLMDPNAVLSALPQQCLQSKTILAHGSARSGVSENADVEAPGRVVGSSRSSLDCVKPGRDARKTCLQTPFQPLLLRDKISRRQTLSTMGCGSRSRSADCRVGARSSEGCVLGS